MKYFLSTDIKIKTKEMSLNEIKVGEFFTIDNTPSYPKLRTTYGYIDARDEITNEVENLNFGINFMSDQDVLNEFYQYGLTDIIEITELKKRLLEVELKK